MPALNLLHKSAARDSWRTDFATARHYGELQIPGNPHCWQRLESKQVRRLVAAGSSGSAMEQGRTEQGPIGVAVASMAAGEGDTESTTLQCYVARSGTPARGLADGAEHRPPTFGDSNKEHQNAGPLVDVGRSHCEPSTQQTQELNQQPNVPRFSRILGTKRAPYRRRKDEVKSALHWGQRKLFLSELEFLLDVCFPKSMGFVGKTENVASRPSWSTPSEDDGSCFSLSEALLAQLQERLLENVEAAGCENQGSAPEGADGTPQKNNSACSAVALATLADLPLVGPEPSTRAYPNTRDRHSSCADVDAATSTAADLLDISSLKQNFDSVGEILPRSPLLAHDDKAFFLVYYIGAAPGEHIALLAKWFAANVFFVLYDPRPFNVVSSLKNEASSRNRGTSTTALVVDCEYNEDEDPHGSDCPTTTSTTSHPDLLEFLRTNHAERKLPYVGADEHKHVRFLQGSTATVYGGEMVLPNVECRQRKFDLDTEFFVLQSDRERWPNAKVLLISDIRSADPRDFPNGGVSGSGSSNIGGGQPAADGGGPSKGRGSSAGIRRGKGNLKHQTDNQTNSTPAAVSASEVNTTTSRREGLVDSLGDTNKHRKHTSFTEDSTTAESAAGMNKKKQKFVERNKSRAESRTGNSTGRGGGDACVSGSRSGQQNTTSNFEDFLFEDLYAQQDWVEKLDPVLAMLKFRLPYHDGSMSYLDGEMRLPMFAPQTSTECRLVTYAKAGKKLYDFTEHGEQMFHFNTEQRVHCYAFTFSSLTDHDHDDMVFGKCNNAPSCRETTRSRGTHDEQVAFRTEALDHGLDNCYDCTAEKSLLARLVAIYQAAARNRRKLLRQDEDEDLEDDRSAMDLFDSCPRSPDDDDQAGDTDNCDQQLQPQQLLRLPDAKTLFWLLHKKITQTCGAARGRTMFSTLVSPADAYASWHSKSARTHYNYSSNISKNQSIGADSFSGPDARTGRQGKKRRALTVTSSTSTTATLNDATSEQENLHQSKRHRAQHREGEAKHELSTVVA
ncbi:unnamed protein product [Amoebophrya sp. A120]|nr:unnamed protein product [Amoebophrya sp. A120]|eukprot:GSA120T00011338001.1